MESPLFFKNNSYNLFGVLHEPDEDSFAQHPDNCFFKNIGTVFCHPFAEEKLISHRSIVNLARHLTDQGMHCFRFDYMGHGDSNGDFEEATIDSRINDIRRAIECFKDQTKVDTIILVGVRLGATLAALAIEQNLQVNSLILISPVVNGKSYIDQCLRSNLTTQLSTYKKVTKDRKTLINQLTSGQPVNIDGYLLTKELYLQMSSVNLLEKSLSSIHNVLLLQLSRRDKQPLDPSIKNLYEMYQNMAVNVELLNIIDTYFWTDTKMYNASAYNTQETISNWLTNTFIQNAENINKL